MGKSTLISQPLVKKAKASGLQKLICETQSEDEDEDMDNSPSTADADLSRPWYADFKNYIDTLEMKPPPGMSIVQWWGISILYIISNSSVPH